MIAELHRARTETGRLIHATTAKPFQKDGRVSLCGRRLTGITDMAFDYDPADGWKRVLPFCGSCIRVLEAHR